MALLLVAVAWAALPMSVGAEEPARPTLLVYSTVQRLLSGQAQRGIAAQAIAADLAEFPADWGLIGIGTTDRTGRNGEVMADGTTSSPEFWWANPGAPSGGDMLDLDSPADPGADAFPFLGLAVADPTRVITWTARSVADVPRWLETRLTAEGIQLAGVEVSGEFGQVNTSVVYSIPVSGLDLSAGYVGKDHFRFGEYMTSTWLIHGIYAADPALHPFVSTAGHPLHLHGYQPATHLGGHVGKAAALDLTVTVWPLDQVTLRRVEEDPS